MMSDFAQAHAHSIFVYTLATQLGVRLYYNLTKLFLVNVAMDFTTVFFRLLLLNPICNLSAPEVTTSE